MSQEPIAPYPRYIATLTGDGPVDWHLIYEEPARWRSSTSATGRRVSLAVRVGSAASREAAIEDAHAAALEHEDKKRREQIVEKVEVYRPPPTTEDLEAMMATDPRGPTHPVPAEEQLRDGELPPGRPFDPRDFVD